MIIFVLHGFASATPNENSKTFQEMYPEANVVNLNYNFDPDIGFDEVTSAVIRHLITMDDVWPIVFTGCSLGGYVARYLAGLFNGQAILMNPAVFPEDSLMRWVGINTNYRTGETFELTEENVRKYSNYRAVDSTPTLVLLDEDDEVLDPNVTSEFYASKAQVVTFAGGSHRFEHLLESEEIIDKFLNTVTG